MFLRIVHKKEKLVPHVAAASHAAVVTSPLFHPAEPSGLCSLLSLREIARYSSQKKPLGPPRRPVHSELGVHGPSRVGSPAHSPRIPQGTLPRGDANRRAWAERSEGRRRGVRTADSALEEAQVRRTRVCEDDCPPLGRCRTTSAHSGQCKLPRKSTVSRVISKEGETVDEAGEERERKPSHFGCTLIILAGVLALSLSS